MNKNVLKLILTILMFTFGFTTTMVSGRMGPQLGRKMRELPSDYDHKNRKKSEETKKEEKKSEENNSNNETQNKKN